MDQVSEKRARGARGGHAFLDRSAWRKVRVTGGDAVTWLGRPAHRRHRRAGAGRGCRSLLLTPTGRIRADVQVARRDDDLFLVQAPEQPEHIGLALSTYVLSADVSLEDRTNDLALFTVPGRAASLVGIHGATEPSSVGPGIDVLVDAGKPAWRFVEACIAAGLEEAGGDAYEVWRVRRGIARMGPDFDERSLPAEVGLESTSRIREKGVSSAREVVARVRNLGHPPRLPPPPPRSGADRRGRGGVRGDERGRRGHQRGS